jgi:hypothetical protein
MIRSADRMMPPVNHVLKPKAPDLSIRGQWVTYFAYLEDFAG